MNVTIKNLRVDERASQETLCFSADLLVDDERVGAVANRGTGGCHDYPGVHPKTMRVLDDWAKTQPVDIDFERFDRIVDGMVWAAIERREVAL